MVCPQYRLSASKNGCYLRTAILLRRSWPAGAGRSHERRRILPSGKRRMTASPLDVTSSSSAPTLAQHVAHLQTNSHFTEPSAAIENVARQNSSERSSPAVLLGTRRVEAGPPTSSPGFQYTINQNQPSIPTSATKTRHSTLIPQPTSFATLHSSSLQANISVRHRLRRFSQIIFQPPHLWKSAKSAARLGFQFVVPGWPRIVAEVLSPIC